MSVSSDSAQSALKNLLSVQPDWFGAIAYVLDETGASRLSRNVSPLGSKETDVLLNDLLRRLRQHNSLPLSLDQALQVLALYGGEVTTLPGAALTLVVARGIALVTQGFNAQEEKLPPALLEDVCAVAVEGVDESVKLSMIHYLFSYYGASLPQFEPWLYEELERMADFGQ